MKKLVVFDLDFTLWDAGGMWCDCTTPPYKKVNDYILDRNRAKISLYNDTRNVLIYLNNSGYKVAVASRTSAPRIAEELLKLFDIDKYIHFKEIFPSGKKAHFYNLKIQTGFDYNNMIFFDDELRNIDEVSSIGVRCIQVTTGISLPLVLKELN